MMRLQARSKQILTGQARKWAGQRGVSGSNYIASLKIQNYQVMSSLFDKATCIRKLTACNDLQTLTLNAASLPS